MQEKETIGVIQEFGDLGGMYSELSEKEQQAYTEAVKKEEEKSSKSN